MPKKAEADVLARAGWLPMRLVTARRAVLTLMMLSLCGCAALSPRAGPAAPLVDYHQHLVSPGFAAVASLPVLDGAALVRKMDEAGVRRAVVLSTGYSMADERKGLSDPDGRTRAENNWTSAQVVGAAGRLIGFCSVNPLRGQALVEIERCLHLPGMRGLKLHFGNSGVSLRNPSHRARLMEVFSLVGRAGVPVLVHLRARGGENFGAPDARLFVNSLLPLVPRSDVIIAHFGGAGPGYPEQADEVMAVFAAAVERRDPRLRRTFFDMATILTPDTADDTAALIARRIGQVGSQRVLYGSDLLSPTAPSITKAWSLVEAKLGLPASALRRIGRHQLGFTRKDRTLLTTSSR